jgi:hypothetical protein
MAIFGGEDEQEGILGDGSQGHDKGQKTNRARDPRKIARAKIARVVRKVVI